MSAAQLLAVDYHDGLHHDIPEADYHAIARFSKSGCSRILRSPAHYRTETFRTPAMQQGSLIDVALTEPERLDSDYHVVPDDLRLDSRSKAYQAEQDKAGERTIVKTRDMDAALRIRDALHRHPTVAELLDGAVSQPVALWTEHLEPAISVPCKARLDWINARLLALIDLKSTDDARSFARTATNYGYHIQDAVYRRGWYMAGGFEPEAFVFIVVERDPPHGVLVHELTDRARELGLRQWHEGLELYAHCRETGRWPGYPEYIEQIDLPGWAYRHHEDL